jgi:mRNA interferase RelE/StbE
LNRVWKVRLSEAARQSLAAIADQRIKRVISDRIDGLATEPEHQGRPLLGALSGYRSVRAAGQRYRVIYQVREEVVTVYVVLVGIRKEGDKRDVYALAQRLFRLGLLGPSLEEQQDSGHDADH